MTLRIMAALRMPEDQSRTGNLLNRKQVELLAENAMIALRRLFQPGEVLFHILVGEEGRAVDTLQLRVLLVAQPVGACQAEHLERLDSTGRRHMGAAAEVHELSVAVKRNRFAGFGELLDEVHLHEIAARLKLLQPLLPRLKLPHERLVALDHLGHATPQSPSGPQA